MRLYRLWAKLATCSKRKKHSFVSSGLECQSHDDASAPKNPGEGRIMLNGKRKTRTLLGGTLREKWKNWGQTVRVTGKELRKEHCKEKIFERGKSNGKKNDWEKWNKNYMKLEELKDTVQGHERDIVERICREREEDWRTGTAGKKCIGRWSGGSNVGVKQSLFYWENLGKL